MLFKCRHCGGMVDSAGCDYGEEIICGHCGKTAQVPSSMFSENAIIDDFIIEKFLGKGGMGMVYRAHQISLDRTVALKILQPDSAMGLEAINDFVKEARSAASLNHPHIVQAYAVGKYQDIYYFGMEYVEGQTVQELMLKDPVLDEDSVLAIGLNIAEALREAWDRKKMIHRDIKPDNIMLTNEGVVKLMDLGLSCSHTESANESDTITGTPQYICPEQIMGLEMDVRGDLYSLGASMYHMMCGEFPYTGNNYNEILRGHLEREAKALTEYGRNISEASWSVIKKLLEKDADKRYQNAQELIAALHEARNGRVGLPESLTASQKMKKLERTDPQDSNGLVVDSVNSKGKKGPNKLIFVAIAAIAVLFIGLFTLGGNDGADQLADKSAMENQANKAQSSLDDEKTALEDLLKKKKEERRKKRELEKLEAEKRAQEEAALKKAQEAAALKKAQEEQLKKEAAAKALEQKKMLEKPVDIISRNFLWSYTYMGSKISPSWMSPNFNDAQWSKGNAPIGYGSTTPPAKTKIKRLRKGVGILYARRKFVLKEIDKSLDYVVAVMADDGAGVWLNGTRVAMINMDAANLKVSGLAKSENVDNPLKFKGWIKVPHSSLKLGLNLIAVELHPSSLKTSDLLFDLKFFSRPQGSVNRNKRK